MNNDSSDLRRIAAQAVLHLGSAQLAREVDAALAGILQAPNRPRVLLDAVINILKRELAGHSQIDALIAQVMTLGTSGHPEETPAGVPPQQKPSSNPDSQADGNKTEASASSPPPPSDEPAEAPPTEPSPTSSAPGVDVLAYTPAQLRRCVLKTLSLAERRPLSRFQIARHIALSAGGTDREAHLLETKVSNILSNLKQLAPPRVGSKGPKNAMTFWITEAGLRELGESG